MEMCRGCDLSVRTERFQSIHAEMELRRGCTCDCRQELIEVVTIGKGEGFKSSFHAAKKMYRGIDCIL